MNVPAAGLVSPDPSAGHPGDQTDAPRLAIVVVNYRTLELTSECLDAVFRHVAPGSFELIVVDNASGGNEAAQLTTRFPLARVIALERNLGFGAGNNEGVRAASAPFVVLLNSDAILAGDTPAALCDYLQLHADVACVGPRIDVPGGMRQDKVWGQAPSAWRVAMQSFGLASLAPWAPLLAGIDGYGKPTAARDVGWISGVCMAMRRADYLAVGGFDPALFMYCEDVDLCLRLSKSGARIVHVDDGAVMHYGGASSRSLESRLRNAVMQQRNLLYVLEAQRGKLSARLACLALGPGHLLRMAVGAARVQRDEGYLLRASWRRFADLFAPRQSPSFSVKQANVGGAE